MTLPERDWPTDDDRRRVEVMVASGTDAKLIARLVGVGLKALRQHFALELEHGRALVALRALRAMVASAEAGDVRAQLSLLQRYGEQTPRAVRRTYVSKKAEQKKTAAAVAGVFAPPAAPKLIVSNQ
jgi:hypothetical protein